MQRGNLRLIEDQGLMFYCPGCESPHSITYKPGGWTFDGNFESPTFNPSLLSNGVDKDGKPERCHMFVRAGVIEFLTDCTHKLAGQRVPIPELPDWLKD